MLETKLLSAVALFAMLAATNATAQDVRRQAQQGVRVQTAPSAARQTPSTDFASALRTGAEDARSAEIDAAVAVLGKLIALPKPAGLSRTELATWDEHTAWLTSVSRRYQGLSSRRAAAARADASTTEQMTQMDLEFQALQQAVQTESRKFQTLSNASKARHDTAMNSIRNIK